MVVLAVEGETRRMVFVLFSFLFLFLGLRNFPLDSGWTQRNSIDWQGTGEVLGFMMARRGRRREGRGFYS